MVIVEVIVLLHQELRLKSLRVTSLHRFIKCCFLKHNFEWTDFHYHTLFEYVEEENIHKLIQAEIDEFDEFCWVDFDDASDLDELEPKEIAELLYLAHKKNHLQEHSFRC